MESCVNARGGADVTGFDILNNICSIGISAAKETNENSITSILKKILITA